MTELDSKIKSWLENYGQIETINKVKSTLKTSTVEAKEIVDKFIKENPVILIKKHSSQNGLKAIGGIITFIVLIAGCRACMPENKNDDLQNDASLSLQTAVPQQTNPPATEPIETVNSDEKEIIIKLKEKAAKSWPNDYTTQEYWINEEIEAYRYMLTIPGDDIKKQAENSWPLDYTTQKYWYNEQIEARERLK